MHVWHANCYDNSAPVKKVSLHRRRKILKVGGAEYPIAREARAKILRPRPLHVKPRPFLHDRGCYHEFLGEKINCKSSRIDLVAIEAYLLIIRPGKCLKIFIVIILGWRTMGALPPFLKYWGGYSPLSPPGSYAYGLDTCLTSRTMDLKVSGSPRLLCQKVTADERNVPITDRYQLSEIRVSIMDIGP